MEEGGDVNVPDHLVPTCAASQCTVEIVVQIVWEIRQDIAKDTGKPTWLVPCFSGFTLKSGALYQVYVSKTSSTLRNRLFIGVDSRWRHNRTLRYLGANVLETRQRRFDQPLGVVESCALFVEILVGTSCEYWHFFFLWVCFVWFGFRCGFRNHCCVRVSEINMRVVIEYDIYLASNSEG